MTRRAIAEGLESRLNEEIPVLDHGFIRVIDYMGNDAAITQAARVSYGNGTKHTQDDRALIRYLMRHWHTTPFEMCEIKLHIKLPIFVARQWIRHRTASVNEYSARYSLMDHEFYIPAHDQCATQSRDNKQGRGEQLSTDDAKKVQNILRADAEQCYGHYTSLMQDHDLARELARMNLTLNYYTQWYWKIDLHNLFHFLYLRADRHAQYEIRAYADAIYDLVQCWVPIATEAFEEYRLKGGHLSKTMLDCVRKLWAGDAVTQENSNLTQREWNEFLYMINNEK